MIYAGKHNPTIITNSQTGIDTRCSNKFHLKNLFIIAAKPNSIGAEIIVTKTFLPIDFKKLINPFNNS